jgi:hypothetical protein
MAQWPVVPLLVTYGAARPVPLGMVLEAAVVGRALLTLPPQHPLEIRGRAMQRKVFVHHGLAVLTPEARAGRRRGAAPQLQEVSGRAVILVPVEVPQGPSVGRLADG